MKIFLFFIGFILIAILIESIESYMKKYDFESKYPQLAILKYILETLALIIIVSTLVYFAYKNLWETASIDNLSHLFILFIPIVIIIYTYKRIKHKIFKCKEKN